MGRKNRRAGDRAPCESKPKSKTPRHRLERKALGSERRFWRCESGLFHDMKVSGSDDEVPGSEDK